MAEVELQTLKTIKPSTRNVIAGKVMAAEAKLAIAQLQLEMLEAGAGADDLAMAASQVDQAEADVQTAQAQVSQAEAQASKAQAAVAKAEAQLNQAGANLDLSAGQLEQAQAQYDLLVAGSRAEDLAAAEASVAQAEAALAGAQNALADSVLVAPFSGTVGAVLSSEGELVGPQLPVIQLGDLTQLQVETVDLSEVDVDHLQVGQSATVTIDALAGKAVGATVTDVAVLATQRLGDRVFAVTLSLDPGSGADLRWGMTAFVEIRTR
jgi:multidrug resistance efflux pump